MGQRGNAGAQIIAIFMVFVLANGVDAHRLYACWGACYNGCFVGKAQTETERFSCDYKCLKSCIPPSSNDLKMFCETGCSMKRCIPVITDGAKLESCFGWCTNLCNKIMHHG